MSDLTKAVLTIVILIISWAVGRIARVHTAPQQRQKIGLGVIAVVVIPLIMVNFFVEFVPRTELRSMLILFCLGWVVGLFRRGRSENKDRSENK